MFDELPKWAAVFGIGLSVSVSLVGSIVGYEWVHSHDERSCAQRATDPFDACPAQQQSCLDSAIELLKACPGDDDGE